MCGIAGIIAGEEHSAVAEQNSSRIRLMLNELRYRGPDASGIFQHSLATLGHSRLSIIDIEDGAQPMTCGEVALTFNGEIYNFQQLREELEALGQVFSTNSDTEVLLKGYCQWGEEVVTHLNGMFAFAIWDGRKKRLFAARDRLGQKPFYWHLSQGGSFVFASELSAILKSGVSPSVLNACMLQKYLILSYLPGDESVVKGVHKLSPGCSLSWAAGEDEPVIREYWNLADVWQKSNARKIHYTQSQQQEEFYSLLEDAVRMRMVADVPLGSFLSSGIDSAVITAIMKKFTPDVKSFNVGFSQKSFDEAKLAQETADCLGTEHSCSYFDGCSVELLQEIASRLDEPFADTSIIPTYYLSKQARKKMKVALTGDGADELLAGYPTLRADHYYRYAHWLPLPIAKAGLSLLNIFPDDRRKLNTAFKLRQFLRAFPRSAAQAHASWRMVLPDRAMDALNSCGALDSIFSGYQSLYDEVDTLNFTDRLLYMDYKTWLKDDILTKVDRASMNNGLEIRSPFLDYRLIEFAAGLPSECKLNSGANKAILRSVAAKILPARILKRKKTGFNSPVGHWLCGSWREIAEAEFSSHRLNDLGVIEQDIISRCWQEHQAGRRNHEFFLFSVLLLSLWLRKIVS